MLGVSCIQHSDRRELEHQFQSSSVAETSIEKLQQQQTNMELKQSSQNKIAQRTKRQSKVLEDNFWDCSVCTYRNTAEAFKCLMCDVRKGTSTRKPRINPQLVAQQVAQQYNPTPPKTNKREGDLKEDCVKEASGKDGIKEVKEESDKKYSSPEKSVKKRWYPPRLKNVDRSTAQTREVTVNNVTVYITEYKPKLKKSVSDQSGQSSSASSENGSQSESSTDAKNGDIGTDSRSS